MKTSSIDDATEASRVLRESDRVEEVAHYGHTLRVATRGREDAAVIVSSLLEGRGHRIEDMRRGRPTVEDAFVAMVRAEEASA